MKKIILFLLAVLLLTGCTKEQPPICEEETTTQNTIESTIPNVELVTPTEPTKPDIIIETELSEGTQPQTPPPPHWRRTQTEPPRGKYATDRSRWRR